MILFYKRDTITEELELNRNIQRETRLRPHTETQKHAYLKNKQKIRSEDIYRERIGKWKGGKTLNAHIARKIQTCRIIK